MPSQSSILMEKPIRLIFLEQSQEQRGLIWCSVKLTGQILHWLQ